MGWKHKFKDSNFFRQASQGGGWTGLATQSFSLGGNYAYGQMTGANQANEANEQNFKLQQENLAYQKWVQQKIWDREDDSVQRRAKDLLLAGQSPILAAGSGAGAGAVVPTTAPHREYARTDMTDAAKMAMSLMTMLPTISKTLAEAENIDAQTKGTKLDNIVRGVNAKNSTNSGIGSGAGMLGEAIKSLTGAGNKIYEDFSGVIGGAINSIKGKLKSVIFDSKDKEKKK